MKKTLSFFLLYFASTSTYGQLTKGYFMPGVSLNFNQSKENHSDSIFASNQSSSIKKSNTYTGINFGYFVKDNFAIGINTGYQKNNYDNLSSTSNGNYTSESKSHQINNSFNIGLFTRYYHMINNGKLGIFLQANAMYFISYGKAEQEYITNNSGNNYPYSSNNKSSDKKNAFNFWLSPGVVYFITNKIGIETSFGTIGYVIENTKHYSQYNHTGDSNSQGFNMDLSSSTIRLGVNYYLGRAVK